MSRLTAAICCFALSGAFTWISNSATTAALNARARATQSGLLLMMKQPVSDTGLANFAMLTAIAMLLIGVGCLIASMFPKKTPQPKSS